MNQLFKSVTLVTAVGSGYEDSSLVLTSFL